MAGACSNVTAVAGGEAGGPRAAPAGWPSKASARPMELTTRYIDIIMIVFVD